MNEASLQGAPAPDQLRWSGTYLLTSGHHLEVGRRPGVYRIRAFNPQGEAIAIGRVNGADPLGILHIGKSVKLGVRVRTFRQAAERLHAPHHAGSEFHRWGFARMFPFQCLRFDYVLVESHDEAIRLERYLHEEYRRQYLDRPPLDGTSGQSQ